LQTQHKIPTLDEVLRLVDGRVPILIEIKNVGSVGELESKLLERLKGYDGEVAIQSFNPFSLGYVAKYAPSIPRGQLSGSFVGEDLAFYVKFILSHMFLNIVSKPHFIAYEKCCLKNFSLRLQRKFGVAVLAWTVEDKGEIGSLKDDADNIIFKGFRP
jgi:glycerophosphoryl diester phosphodiesterase